jgi:hypothetical protein
MIERIGFVEIGFGQIDALVQAAQGSEGIGGERGRQIYVIAEPAMQAGWLREFGRLPARPLPVVASPLLVARNIDVIPSDATLVIVDDLHQAGSNLVLPVLMAHRAACPMWVRITRERYAKLQDLLWANMSAAARPVVLDPEADVPSLDEFWKTFPVPRAASDLRSLFRGSPKDSSE